MKRHLEPPELLLPLPLLRVLPLEAAPLQLPEDAPPEEAVCETSLVALFHGLSELVSPGQEEATSEHLMDGSGGSPR